jgi:phosphoenolpyruvate carboxykinase (GTP)
MAMLPFCGYHMGDYFAHWLKIGANADPGKLPRIYYVNWFRKDKKGGFLWPGYGENARVLQWICDRISGQAQAIDTPIGRLPAEDALDLSGLELAPATLDQLLAVKIEDWKAEVRLIKEHFETFGDKLPQSLWEELAQLEERLKGG